LDRLREPSTQSRGHPQPEHLGDEPVLAQEGVRFRVAGDRPESRESRGRGQHRSGLLIGVPNGLPGPPARARGDRVVDQGFKTCLTSKHKNKNT